ncbi:hypothetical protein ANRL3_01175 [Anaerolineae bacterium]|nr:hypothetical protein ANRL3_01175 [Anaerolineae bacterium]
MQSQTMQGLVLEETTQFLVAEAIQENAAQKENAQEIAALEASTVACATVPSTTEYTTNEAACQDVLPPTLEEIENEIAQAARQRIEAVRMSVADTRERIEREQVARTQTLEAMHARAIQIQTTLDGLSDERAAMETRAQTFLSGDALNAMLGKIHLAFNTRQLELEDALATAKTDEVETQEEIQAASVSDLLELQFAEQELERLEAVAPDVAEAIQQAEAVTRLIANAERAIQDGLLRDAATLIEQAKKANTESFGSAQAKDTVINNLEHALTQARQAKLVRDLIARLNTHPELPGAMKRIYRLIDEAKAAGVAEQVAATVARVQQIAGEAKRGRLAQARPIADHLASEGFMPVVSDGRIEAWQLKERKNGSAQRDHSQTWVLDQVYVLNVNGTWATEKPTVVVTRQELAPHALESKWYREWAAKRKNADVSPT